MTGTFAAETEEDKFSLQLMLYIPETQQIVGQYQKHHPQLRYLCNITDCAACFTHMELKLYDIARARGWKGCSVPFDLIKMSNFSMLTLKILKCTGQFVKVLVQVLIP